MPQRNVSSDVASSLTSIKSIVGIVNGLTLTNTLLVLLTGGHYDRVRPLADIPIEDVAFAAVLIANIVRFYHGNVRHLDSAYGDEGYARAASGRHTEPRGGLGIDFFVVFAQSLMFSVASFYVASHSEYLSVLITLLAFDVIWTVYSQQVTADEHSAAPQRGWLLNNFLAVIALGSLYFMHRTHPSRVWTLDAGLAVLAITTLVDFALSWDFYFPRTQTKVTSE